MRSLRSRISLGSLRGSSGREDARAEEGKDKRKFSDGDTSSGAASEGSVRGDGGVGACVYEMGDGRDERSGALGGIVVQKSWGRTVERQREVV